VIHR